MDKSMIKRNQMLGQRLAGELISRKFSAFYCETMAEAAELALSLIPEDHVVSFGGSVTIADSGIVSRLRQSGTKIIDRDTAADQAERQRLMRDALTCDTYLTSVNAISEDGTLVCVDGVGNRVAAMCYGPKSVIAIVGMNKVCKTEADAERRARTVASPLNAVRVGAKGTPCSSTGSCHDCKSADCICSFVVKTRFCRVQDRIKVILVGESAGY